MAKKAKEPLESHHIKLFVGDFEELDRILAGRLPASVAVRLLVRDFILRTNEKAQQTFKSMEINVDDILANSTGEPDESGSDIQQEPS